MVERSRGRKNVGGKKLEAFVEMGEIKKKKVREKRTSKFKVTFDDRERKVRKSSVDQFLFKIYLYF